MKSMMKEMAMITPTHSQARVIFPESMAIYIAVGIVWVCPGMFPANMSVAPNSPKALAELNIAPVRMDLPANGRDTYQNNVHSPAPSTLAAFSISSSMPSKPVLADWYISGKATTVEAITAAHQVNMIGWLNTFSMT